MAPASGFEGPLAGEPTWPATGGLRPVFLLDASSGLERRLLEDWIERHRPADLAASGVDAIAIPPARRRIGGRRGAALLERLDACLAAERDALLAPLRVAWLPKKRDGERAVRLVDLLTLRDPRDPRALRQAWILRREPDRCRIVAGEPAPASELRERWRRAGGEDASHTTGLADFVSRQGVLALERAERRLRGARYKVPRLVAQDVLGRSSVRGGLARLARELDRPEARVQRDAARYLREIAATHSPFVIDLVGHGIRLLYSQGYGKALHYDRRQLRAVKTLSQRHPVVFLPSHKSNLDHLVLQYALHENGHAPNHTAGGINMNFFPLGPLVRRSGVFFIRRTFKDNPVYKFVLRHYVDYLIEKRFTLEWYIEGGRSRSGKLLPPRFGLLTYVVDAFRRGVSEDVFLVPVSIAYDQIQDVGEYAAEQSGAPKEKESFSWFVRLIRRMGRRYGDIHFRFGEPISLAKFLGRDAESAAEPESPTLAVQKLAFEVAVRINRVTPITPTSLVAFALLGQGDRALTLEEIRRALENVGHYVRERDLPRTQEVELEDPDDPGGLVRSLEALEENGVVSRFSEGSEAVYRIGPDQQLAAAYYRNTIIHFFVNGAIAELALVRAGEEDVADPVSEFWDEAMRLRDLLKFEFFFSDKETFLGELRRELAFHDGRWEERLRAGGSGIPELLRSIRPFSAHRVLRPFLDAYRVVGDALEQVAPDAEFEEGKFVDHCLGVARQYLLQRRVHSAASVSQVLMKTALRLAENRELLQPGAPELGGRRREFAAEIRDAVRRTEAIEALAAGRRAGLID